MPNINDIISQMPQIPRPAKPTSTPQEFNRAVQDQSSVMMNQTMPAILQFISRELSIKKEMADYKETQEKIQELIDSIETLVEANDKSNFMKEVFGSLDKIVDKLSDPEVNITMPDEGINGVRKATEDVVRAVRDLKINAPDKVTVNNLDDVTKAINDLKPLITKLTDTVEESKLEAPEQVLLDAESKKYLKNLEFLDTDAKNPLAVRLSDGKEFIKGLGNAVGEQVRILGGGSTSSFKDSSGGSQKALLDANNIAKVTQDNYTVKIVYVSAGLPQYIGKALPGTASSAAGWQIQKLTYSSTDVTDIKWAGGSLSFTNIFDNYASFTYS